MFFLFVPNRTIPFVQHEWQFFDTCRRNREINTKQLQQYFRGLVASKKGTELSMDKVIEQQLARGRAAQTGTDSLFSPSLMVRHASRLGTALRQPTVAPVLDFSQLVFPSRQCIESLKWVVKLGQPSLESVAQFPTEADTSLSEFPIAAAGFPWFLSIRSPKSALSIELKVGKFQTTMENGMPNPFGFIPVTNPFFVLSGAKVVTTKVLRDMMASLYVSPKMKDTIAAAPATYSLLLRLLRPDAPPEIVSAFTSYGDNLQELERILHSKIDFSPPTTLGRPMTGKVHVSQISFVAVLPLCVTPAEPAYVGPVPAHVHLDNLVTPVETEPTSGSSLQKHLHVCFNAADLGGLQKHGEVAGRTSISEPHTGSVHFRLTTIDLNADPSLLLRFDEAVQLVHASAGHASSQAISAPLAICGPTAHVAVAGPPHQKAVTAASPQSTPDSQMGGVESGVARRLNFGATDPSPSQQVTPSSNLAGVHGAAVVTAATPAGQVPTEQKVIDSGQEAGDSGEVTMGRRDPQERKAQLDSEGVEQEEQSAPVRKRKLEGECSSLCVLLVSLVSVFIRISYCLYQLGFCRSTHANAVIRSRAGGAWCNDTFKKRSKKGHCKEEGLVFFSVSVFRRVSIFTLPVAWLCCSRVRHGSCTRRG